jgi:hypothetical protein
MTAATAKLWGGDQGWRAAIWLVVIAFALQSFVAQTHIHDAATVIHQSVSGSHGKPPIDNGPLDCPLCQAVAHGSTYFPPASALFLLPAACIELATSVLSLRVTFVVAAHSWKSRAPPKV